LDPKFGFYAPCALFVDNGGWHWNLWTRLIDLEEFEEILGHLMPKELLVVALRWSGLPGAQICELLGISKACLSGRLAAARERVLREMPELAPRVKGRSLRRGSRKRDDGQDW